MIVYYPGKLKMARDHRTGLIGVLKYWLKKEEFYENRKKSERKKSALNHKKHAKLGLKLFLIFLIRFSCVKIIIYSPAMCMCISISCLKNVHQFNTCVPSIGHLTSLFLDTKSMLQRKSTRNSFGHLLYTDSPAGKPLLDKVIKIYWISLLLTFQSWSK